MDNHLPNLVNLNEDPQLSEIMLYRIKEGTNTVGKYRPSSSHDIQLSGVLIADDHWCVPQICPLQLPSHTSPFKLRRWCVTLRGPLLARKADGGGVP